MCKKNGKTATTGLWDEYPNILKSTICGHLMLCSWAEVYWISSAVLLTSVWIDWHHIPEDSNTLFSKGFWRWCITLRITSVTGDQLFLRGLTECLLPFTWARKQIQFPKCFLVFRILNDGQSPEPQQFWILFSICCCVGVGPFLTECTASVTSGWPETQSAASWLCLQKL
jgi:hypothetical protein